MLSPAVNKVQMELNQNQYDALVSLVFNIGGGAFKNSTILKHLNPSDYAAAAAAWIDPKTIFNKSGGQYCGWPDESP